MRMDPRIEKLAGELIALPLAELPAGEITERIAATLGDADPDVAQAALDLAAELVRQRTADAAKQVLSLRSRFIGSEARSACDRRRTKAGSKVGNIALS
jgi:hypothetical protein